MINTKLPSLPGKLFILLISVILFPNIACTRSESAGNIHVPLLSAVTVDGRGEEYVNAYHALIEGIPEGELVSKEDLSVSISIGYTKEGIALFANVMDDTLIQGTNHAWEGDGLEIFVADSCGSENTVQYSIAMLNPVNSDTGLEVFDRRYGMQFISGGDAGFKTEAICKVGRETIPGGYNMEVLIPFSVLFGIDSIPAGMALEIWVNDNDSTGEKRTQYTWNYSGKMLLTSWAMTPVIMDTTASSAVLPVRAQVIDEKKIMIQFPSDPDLSSLVVSGPNEKRIGFEFAGRNIFGLSEIEIPGAEVVRLDYINLMLENEVVAKIYPDLVKRVYKELPVPNQFEEDIRCYEFRDKRNAPPLGATLFVGSSSFVMWKTLGRDMEGLTVLNRGFGGSTMTDLLYYFNRIVLPYKPSRIVCYEGDNDLGKGIDPAVFADSARKFVEQVQKMLPGTEICFLSIKPSFARMWIAEKTNKANELLKEIAATTEGVSYIDVASPMFDENGNLRKDIFLKDGLHMNEEGYKIWTKEVREALGLQ